MNHIAPVAFDLYLDDQLDHAARAAVEQHLATCAACRRERDALAALLADLEALPSLPLPVDLAPLVLAHIPPAPVYAWRLRAILALELVLIGGLAWQTADVWTGWARNVWAALGRLAFVDALLASWLRLAQPATWQERIVAAIDGLNRSQPELAWSQWSLLLAFVALAWIVGNVALLAGQRRAVVVQREQRNGR